MEKKGNTNEVYYYLRGTAKSPAPKGMKKEKQNGPPLITVCVSQLPDGTLCRGIAICSPKDAPSKKEGRRIARNYMLKARGTKKTDIIIKRHEAISISNKVQAFFMFHSGFAVPPTNREKAMLYKDLRKEAG